MYLTIRDRAPSGARPLRRKRVSGTVVLLGVVSMVTDISSESVNAVLPKYLIFVVGLSPQAFGFVNGLYTGASAVMRLLGGWLADRTDRPKWVAFVGYLASALTRIGLLAANGFGAISLLITGDRLGKGLRTAPRDAIIAEVSDPSEWGRAYGTHRALDTLGAALGPLLAFWILTVVVDGFHVVFVASFAFAAIGLVVLLLFVPDVRPRRTRQLVPPAADPLRRQPALPVGLRNLLANRGLARVVLAAGLLGLVTVGDAFIYLQLQVNFSFSNSNYALLMVGMNVAYLVLAVPVGHLADRVGRAKVFIGGHLALLLCYVTAGGWSQSWIVPIGSLAMLGAYYAATDGILAALASRSATLESRTSSIALAQTVQAVTAFASSVAVGILWSQVGLTTALRCYIPLLVLVVPIASLVLRGAGRDDDRP